jgi:hypothetical protein
MVRSLRDDSERYNNERRETRRRQGQDEVGKKHRHLSDVKSGAFGSLRLARIA